MREPNDQPVCCPKCGARTEFTELQVAGSTPMQEHVCLGCKFPFTIDCADGTEIVNEDIEQCPNCKEWSDHVLPFGRCGFCHRMEGR